MSKLQEIRASLKSEDGNLEISNKSETFNENQYLDKAKNTTELAVIEMNGLINESENKVRDILQKNIFSPLHLNNALMEQKILKVKLKGLKKILKEYF